MSLTESSDSLLRDLIALSWAQWTELGVAGATGTHASMIDPEALLVATCNFARMDPRLFDEVLDWLSLNSSVLDVTRLRKIGGGASKDQSRVLGVLIDFMSKRSSEQKWSASAERMLAREGRTTYGEQALFLRPDGSALVTPGTPDPFFDSHSLHRPALKLRGMSTRPGVRSPALGRLRLRSLVGQGVRAEALLYLSSHDHAHGRLIAERTAYSQRQVAEYLAILAEAGLAKAWNEGRTVQYRLTPGLLGTAEKAAPYVDWVGGFRALSVLWTTVSEASKEPDAYSSSMRLRTGLRIVREMLPLEGLGLSRPDPDEYPGPRLVGHAIDYVDEVGKRLRELSGQSPSGPAAPPPAEHSSPALENPSPDVTLA